MRHSLFAAFAAAGLCLAQTDTRPNTGITDPSTFLLQYERWRVSAQSAKLSMPLIGFDLLSDNPGAGAGQVNIDFRAGTVTSRVDGLPAGDYDLWLVDNRPSRNHSTLPEAGDTMLNLGHYRLADGAYVIEARYPGIRPEGFEVDRVAVTRAGKTPAEAFVLLGAAGIFERLFRGQVRLSETGAGIAGEDSIWQLISKGRALFHQETFGGNGRSCGSCHNERNNFTVDPAFIATLAASDPLFVHEREPALAQNFENKDLLRRLGLILANADGFEDLTKKFVYRAVPSLQGVGLQSTAPDPFYGIDFTSPGVPERLGWGNDNLPLREFSIGAIMQHMSKSLGRRKDTDFRLPTDEELDAIAAYMLAIGRGEDFDLSRLRLNSPEAGAGLRLYTDTGAIGEKGHKNCNTCHFNAGGTVAFAFNPGVPGFSPIMDRVVRGFNGTAGTNVNGLPAAALIGPRDGGAGRTALPTRGFGAFGSVPGVGTFPVEEFTSNSLVEAADTAPYFHNHSVATLEEAVAFYGTKAYAEDPLSIGAPDFGGPIPVKISDNPNDPEVLAIATFLRVLNTLENIRSALSAATRARRAVTLADAAEIAGLGREEVVDAIEVLSAGSAGRNGEYGFVLTRVYLNSARAGLDRASKANDRAALEIGLGDALVNLRAAREQLSDPATLPASYRN